MVKIVNGSEMSLTKQYLESWLVFIKQEDRSFSRIEKNQITGRTQRSFKLLEAVITSASGQIRFGWKILSRLNKKIILEDNLWPEACKVNLLLRNLRYDNNSTQN